MRVLLSNGTHDDRTGLVNYTLADNEAVSVHISTNAFVPPTLHTLQRASTRQSALFVVEKDFAPTKLMVGCSTCAANSGFKSIRFAVTTP